MRRRDLLRLLAAAPALGLPSADTGPTAPARSFYVSPTGNDRAPGTAPDTPWRTIGQVNARLTDATVRSGDTVLFQRGGTFFGKIRPQPTSRTAGKSLTLGSYGPGTTEDRPVISSYKLLTTASGWRRAEPSVWAVDLSPANAGITHGGYDGRQGGSDNIGFLKVDGVIHGNRVWQRSELHSQWDFYCADSVLHVRSEDDPTRLAVDIKAACDGNCISLVDSLRVTGLRLEGSGGHGIEGSAANVMVDDNEFAELGGSQLDVTTRYGNGFQAWIDSADIVVERNIFHDIYDAAITAQGGPISSTGSWTNLAFRENLVHSCNQSVEFWSESDGRPGKGFVNCVVECNTCLYAGYGWSASVRPDRDTRVHLLTYGWALPADIQVRRNTFYDAALAYRCSSTPAPGMVCSDNLVYQRDGGLLECGDPRTIDRSAEWVAATGSDRASRFQVLPDENYVDVARALRYLSADQPTPCRLPRFPSGGS